MGGKCRIEFCRSAQSSTWSQSGSRRGSTWPTPRSPRGPPRSQGPTRTPLTATNRSTRALRRPTAHWSRPGGVHELEHVCRGSAGLDLSSQQVRIWSLIGPAAFLGTPPLRRRAVMLETKWHAKSKPASSAFEIPEISHKFSIFSFGEREPKGPGLDAGAPWCIDQSHRHWMCHIHGGRAN